MTDLHLLCADVKNERSPIKLKICRAVAEIYLFLRRPSDKTGEAYARWKEDFKYIYGDADSNLSSNSKLDRQKLFRAYGISSEDCGTEALLSLFFSVQKMILMVYLLGNRRFAHASCGRIYSCDRN